MEDMNMIIKKQPPPPLAIHKHSQIISKVNKPKIRIIHIFAPEIIETDVANFRELVQRLTGKPSSDHHHQKPCNFKTKKSSRTSTTSQPQRTLQTKKVDLVTTGFGNSNYRDNNNYYKVIKEEEEEEIQMWNGANSGGFLAGFADLDGFIQELGEFPMLPNLEPNYNVSSNHHMKYGFEETQLV